jgi:hypothetical protein
MDQDEAPAEKSKNATPELSPQKRAQQQRLADALRANLRKRKAQTRGRKAQEGGAGDGSAGEDSGAGPT